MAAILDLHLWAFPGKTLKYSLCRQRESFTCKGLLNHTYLLRRELKVHS